MNKYPTPRRVKPISLKVLRHIENFTKSSGDSVLQDEFNIIIIVYFLFLLPVDYNGSKSEGTIFRLKEVAFICGRRIFATTTTESGLQAATFFTLAFTSQKNEVRGKKIDHKNSGEPILCPKSFLLRCTLHICKNSATPTAPLYPTS